MVTKTTAVLAEPGKQEIIVTREFDASRELVFKAYTDPTLIRTVVGTEISFN